MSSYAQRRRRFSRGFTVDGSGSVSKYSQSLQIPVIPQTTVSLHASGRARMIFRLDPASFEGVLITNDGEETFSITGCPSTKILSENQSNGVMDVKITDGETGQLYVIQRVDLLPPIRMDEEEMESDGEIFKTDDFDEPKFRTLSKPLKPNSFHEHSEIPHYELRSEFLKFSTEEILVGNRADKEIRMFLNPDLVGRQLNVHVGSMNVEFDTTVTPPPTPNYGRFRRQGSCDILPVCANGNNHGSTSDACSITTDADINFLM